jgi:sterol desaturase/sphingolipid hydroxylase (fatty acid hydroxylase superfamily)
LLLLFSPTSTGCFLVWSSAAVQSHSGFDLPYDPFNRGVFHGGARRHDFHHSHNHGCYADFLPFWDWLCSTDGAYKAYWDKRKHLAASI